MAKSKDTVNICKMAVISNKKYIITKKTIKLDRVRFLIIIAILIKSVKIHLEIFNLDTKFLKIIPSENKTLMVSIARELFDV